MNRRKFYVLNAVFPILAGGLLYYLFCPDTWFVVQIDSVLGKGIHFHCDWNTNIILRYLRNYLFDILWAYSLVFTIYLLQDNDTQKAFRSFMTAFLFGTVTELAQRSGVYPGTFDKMDIIAELAAETAAVFIINKTQLFRTFIVTNSYKKLQRKRREKMKKLRSIAVMMAVMLVFGSMALGSGSTDDSVDKEIKNAGSKAESGDAGDSVDATEAEEGNLDNADGSSDVTIDEVVLLDESNIKITATGLEDGWLGTELKLLIENNSDKDITVQARNAAVNGFMVDTTMSADVAAGKKTNDALTFMTSALKDCGIDTFAVMEFSFHILTTADLETYLDTDAVTVETSVADTYTQSYDDSGTVFYDADGIKIVGKGLSADDSVFGPGLIVYIENNSDKNFTVQVRDTSVNGFMIDTSMSQDVCSGKKAITAVTFFDTSLEENGIEDITEIETSFHVFEMNSWDTIVDTDPITISF